MKLLFTLNRWISKISLFGAILIFCLVGISVFAQVLFRYCFSVALIWVDEFARYGLVWFVFLGGAAAIESIEETCVTFLRQRIPRKVLRWINLVFHLSIVAFLIVLVKAGLDFAEMGKISKTLALGGISQFVPFLAIPVGSTLIAVSFAVRTVTDFFSPEMPAFGKEGNGGEGS